MSLPPAFASLERTAAGSLGACAPADRGAARPPRVRPPALAHLERALFSAMETGQHRRSTARSATSKVPAGAGTLERVAEELLALIRGGTAPEQIALVCPRVERYRAPLETALGSLGVPYAIEGRIRFEQTEFGRARCSRYCASPGKAATAEISTASCARPTRVSARASVDWVEGGYAAAPSENRRADGGKDDAAPRRPPPAAARARPERGDAPRCGRRSVALHASLRLRPRRAPRRRSSRRRIFVPSTPLSRLRSELEVAGAWRLADPGRDRRALERAPVRAGGGQGAASGRVDVRRSPAPARTPPLRDAFILGLEEGRCHTAARRRRSWTKRPRASSTPALRRSRLAKPIRSSAHGYLFYPLRLGRPGGSNLVRDGRTMKGRT